MLVHQGAFETCSGCYIPEWFVQVFHQHGIRFLLVCCHSSNRGNARDLLLLALFYAYVVTRATQNPLHYAGDQRHGCTCSAGSSRYHSHRMPLLPLSVSPSSLHPLVFSSVLVVLVVMLSLPPPPPTRSNSSDAPFHSRRSRNSQWSSLG